MYQSQSSKSCAIRMSRFAEYLKSKKSEIPPGQARQRDSQAQSPAFPCVIDARNMDCARRSFWLFLRRKLIALRSRTIPSSPRLSIPPPTAVAPSSHALCSLAPQSPYPVQTNQLYKSPHPTTESHDRLPFTARHTAHFHPALPIRRRRLTTIAS
jgi:hypothetical protein